jgi:methionyl-tRNA synthetase
MLQHRYFTTPIYYANGNPHAGHVYTTILASILKKHYLSRGFQTRFLTGLDEHGEAVESKAKELNLAPQEHVNRMAEKWKKSFQEFDIDYDVFLRTTSQEHKQNVSQILDHCHKNGDIYYGEHEGLYCVKCESFLNNSEKNEQNECLVHKIPTELRKEGNYFFKISKYKDQLRELISHKKITKQERYTNELLSLLEHMEGDLSISRPKSRTTWGVELPFDKSHVAYVWFDALPNYVTGIGGYQEAKTSAYWKQANHILGKDILKFHGIFWPAMCLSLDIPVPSLLVTGWILKDGHKMSKSLGNVLSVEQILHYGRDMFSNFVFRVVNPGEDIDISWKSYFERYNSDLSNGVGNLLSRTLSMIEKYFDKKIPSFSKESLSEEQKSNETFLSETVKAVSEAFDEFRIADALQEIWKIVAFADKHIANTKPWELAKHQDDTNRTALANVIATCVACLKAVGYLAYPFFPEKMSALLTSIGEDIEDVTQFAQKLSKPYQIQSGFTLKEMPKLYNRLDIAAELKTLEIEKPVETQSKPNTKINSPASQNQASTSSTINFEQFAQVEMRVGTVVKAELVDGSDKLLKLQVSLGTLGLKQIFSGIRAWVKPEEIANKKVLIVSNLAPRKMKFGLSEGMLLTAETSENKVIPIYLNEELMEGSVLT